MRHSKKTMKKKYKQRGGLEYPSEVDSLTDEQARTLGEEDGKFHKGMEYSSNEDSKFPRPNNSPQRIYADAFYKARGSPIINTSNKQYVNLGKTWATENVIRPLPPPPPPPHLLPSTHLRPHPGNVLPRDHPLVTGILPPAPGAPKGGKTRKHSKKSKKSMKRKHRK